MWFWSFNFWWQTIFLKLYFVNCLMLLWIFFNKHIKIINIIIISHMRCIFVVFTECWLMDVIVHTSNKLLLSDGCFSNWGHSSTMYIGCKIQKGKMILASVVPDVFVQKCNFLYVVVVVLCLSTNYRSSVVISLLSM